MAYQLDRPDLGRGLVVALRRPQSPFESARFPLRGLEAASTYLVTDLDTGAKRYVDGGTLLHDGLGIQLRSRPGSVLLTYERE